MQSGLNVDIKIQSISDVITNSSTQVFILYDPSDLKRIKKVADSILAINSDLKFDDLFTIKLTIDEECLEEVYDNDESVQDEFPTWEEFILHAKNASYNEIAKYNQIYRDRYYYDGDRTVYNGYIVSVREDIESTETLEKAAQVLSQLDWLFSYDVSYES